MTRMATLPGTDLTVDLQPGERVLSSVGADGFFASKHSGSSPRWQIVITDRRFIALAKRGMMKKKLDEVASWPLSSFTERLNSSEGSALGSFMYVITLFAADGETVSTGFKSSREAEAFKHEVVNALGPILG